jgi:predicted RNA binding protein YcfA (HicA-like mRNA interferase family)
MSLKGDLKKLIKRYKADGWTVEETGGRHLKWTPPGGGQAVYSASTPGDARSIKNTIAQLKRALNNPFVPSYS